MSNNGNVSSFIIIGVSDDGKNFVTVDNPNLTDDNIQDFCKKAIIPPPKVKVYRQQWRHGAPDQLGKEFVIIHIGPQKRQAFRLNQDFIGYDEKVCFRRNEVWIRRGATSDLATPEEIARLVKGEPFQVDEVTLERQEERAKFNLLSSSDKIQTIVGTLKIILRSRGYYELPEEQRPTIKNWGKLANYTFPTFLKLFDKNLMLVLTAKGWNNLTQTDLKYYKEYFYSEIFNLSDLKTYLANKRAHKFNCVRRLWILPVVELVPRTRIQKVLPSWSWTGTIHHYYLNNLEKGYHSKGIKRLPSSSEILILDKIASTTDFIETFEEAMDFIEECENTIIEP